MNNCSKNKGYSGQAMVIALVVIVVSVIIGMSIMARSLRDKKSSNTERYSTEALEISDSVIDIFSTVDTETLFDNIEYEGGEIKRLENISQLQDYLKKIGVESDISSLFKNCSDDNSGIVVSMNKVDSEPLELLESNTFGYRLNPLQVQDQCTLTIKAEPTAASSVGLILHKIYGKGYPSSIEYKNYDFDDVVAYCISDDSTTCKNSSLADGAWIIFDKATPLKINLKESKDGYMLDEVRITAIGGVLGIENSLSVAGCAGDMDLKMVKLSVMTTCNGESRGKEVLVPNSNNLSYSTLFDYVFYNNQGFFQPY
ncbi:MAG: hypothetical protein ACOX6Q_02170 [Candidatus Dojkabacteria bacterium]|jgi:hypothetical protein